MCRFGATAVGLLMALTAAGCSEKNCPCTTRTASVTEMQGSTELASGASSEPVSDRAMAIEADDARAGDAADRTGTNPARLTDIEIKNLSREGNIWVGGEPTLEGYRQVHARGVKAIVDLRNPTPRQKEAAEEARRLGIDYVNLPIDPRNMDDQAASDFLAFMREHEGEQVLIHCGSANRASGMYAVYLGAVKGLPVDEAIWRAKRTGLREPELERDVRNYLERHTHARPQAR